MLSGIMKVCFSQLSANLLNLVQKEGEEIPESSRILRALLNSDLFSKHSLILKSPHPTP